MNKYSFVLFLVLFSVSDALLSTCFATSNRKNCYLQSSLLKMSSEEPSFKPMKKFIIKRNIPDADKMTAEQLNSAGCGSKKINHDQGNKCVWINSYIAPTGTYCIYAAASAEDVEEHAKCLTPDSPYEITEIVGTLDVTGAYLRNVDCAKE